MSNLIRFSTALLLGASFSSAAMAVVPFTTTVTATGLPAANTTSLTASVETGSATNTTNGTVSADAVNLSKFNTSTGILVGAKVKVSGVSTANNA